MGGALAEGGIRANDVAIGGIHFVGAIGKEVALEALGLKVPDLALDGGKLILRSSGGKYAIKTLKGWIEITEDAFRKLGGNAPRTGAWTAGFDHLGRGLGKLAGKQVTATTSGLKTIRNHLSKLDPSDANAVMLRRIEDAIEAGRPLEGADAVFYTHEIAEQAIIKSRLASHGGDYLDHYNFAHGKVLEIYGNSPFSVYHPEAILADDFLRTNSNWLKFWGIDP